MRKNIVVFTGCMLQSYARLKERVKKTYIGLLMLL
jgi:hypothetical protein